MFTNSMTQVLKDRIANCFEHGRYNSRTLTGILKSAGLQELFNDAVKEILADMGAQTTTRRRDRSTLYTID